MKYSHNLDFFNHDTPESFYWAGFIAADGCVSSKNSKGPFYLRLCLSNKDYAHLVKFRDAISPKLPVVKQNGRVDLRLCSKYVCSSLGKFNIVERKTFTYTFPDWIGNHKHVNYFMRGYFDGDGCFYTYRNKDSNIDNLAFSVCGTKNLVSNFKYILKLHIKDLLLPGNIYKNSSIYSLGCKGNKKASKIRDFLYKDSYESIRLERKYIISHKFDYTKSYRCKKIIGTGPDKRTLNFDAIKNVKEYGFCPKLISMCCLGKRKKHGGYEWTFA